MKKILAIMPISIGGRLTTSSIIDGFRKNGFEIFIYDELKNENFSDFLNREYDFIIGYDFSPVKLKIDYKIKTPCIAYFSDDINKSTAGVGYFEYKKYLKCDDMFVFYWDRELCKKESEIKNLFYQPHFVNCDIYYDYKEPKNDILFMGRFDTDLRLNTFIELNKKLTSFSFEWYAIEKHYKDALSRCKNKEEENIIKRSYKGFIDNESDMAGVINNSKIVYNINAQGISSLNYRTIQVLACKRLIISDERDELDIFNNIIPTYKNTDELAKKIEHYLNNKQEYENITQKAHIIVREKLNSKICVKNMLDKISFV